MVEKEIKVKTKKFSLRKGKLRLKFVVPEGRKKLTGLFLKKRNVLEEVSVPFHLKPQGNCYDAELDLGHIRLDVAFWDIVAAIEDGGKEYEAMIGGQSVKLKLKLILFPRWYRKNKEYIIYPFVNGARQFTIQCRKYNKGYDSYGFILPVFY